MQFRAAFLYFFAAALRECHRLRTHLLAFPHLLLPLLMILACGHEATLMRVCPLGAAFIYPRTGDIAVACPDPEPIIWPQIPIRVGLNSSLAEYAESADAAIRFWNHEIDLPLFVRVDSGRVDVFIAIGDMQTGIAGSTGHVIFEGRLSALIEMRDLGDLTDAYYVLAHELGHVVGLAHDPGTDYSVMAPSLDRVQELPIILVTAADRAAIRRLYAPQVRP